MNSMKNSTFSSLLQNFDRKVFSFRPFFAKESNQQTIVSINNNVSIGTTAEHNDQTMGNQNLKSKVKTNKLTELTDEQVDLLIESTKLSEYQVRQWHQSNGNSLDRSKISFLFSFH